MQDNHKAPTPKRQPKSARNFAFSPNLDADYAPEKNIPMAKQFTDARQAPFVWFDIALDDAGLSVFAFRLYCHLARVTSGGKNPFFESLTHAAALCKMSLRSARDAMRHLEQRQMVKRTEERIGYTWIYALTDKAEWVATPAGDAGVPRQEMLYPPAADAGVPRQEMPPHVKNKKKKHEERSKAAPAEAAAATHTRANQPAAAASRFAELEILDYLDVTKPRNKDRNSGLAHKLWRSGEDDHLIQRWQDKQALATAPIPPPPPAPIPLYTTFWSGVLPTIRARVNEASFKTWFAPLNAEPRADQVVVISVPDQVFAEWLETNYADVLSDVGLNNREWKVTN